jgi:predicted amidohydrolase
VYSTDPADLFAQLYDALPERLFAHDEGAEDWLVDEAVAEIAADVEHEVVVTGRLSEETTGRFLDVEEEDRNRFAILTGLDHAFLQADLVTGTYDESELVEVTLRYLETGRLNTDSVSGAVLPKIAVPAQDHLLPESLRDAFGAIVRVPAETQLAVQQVLIERWPSRTMREAGFFVAALPAFGREAALEVERIAGSPSSYRLRLTDTGREDQWVRERLAALDAAGAFVAVLPELALTPALLTAWRENCRATIRTPGNPLRWIVLGSGPEHDQRDVRPHNRAVIVERETGKILWHQDKQYRFQLEPQMIERWALVGQLGTGPLEEWISVGGSMVVAEAPGFRGSVLICEDLTQLDTVGATVRAWNVSHAFCPIFSQAIRRYRWENQHGAWLLAHAGVQIVVCNSKWLGDTEPELSEPPGDVLAISNDVRLEETESPLEPVILRFTEHGVFVLQ